MLEDYRELQPEFYDFALKIADNNKISHAYFIETSSFKDGKKLAIAFAKFLLFNNYKSKGIDFDIENINNLIDNGSYRDLYIVEPDGVWIKKEQILSLKEEFSSKSVNDSLRIYIIDQADKLNKAAANSMLKFLEEPEENIVAILLADNRYNVIKTILSRCQTFKLKGEENLNYDNQIIIDMFDFVMNLERNGLKTICYINDLWNKKYSTKDEYSNNFDIISEIYMDVINYKLGKNTKFNSNISDIEYISRNNEIDDLLRKINVINKAIENSRFNINSSLMMDKLIIDIVGG